MSVKLTITVADITNTLLAGYTHIKVYRSAEQETGFSEITTPSSKIPLETGVSVYEFIDYNGTTEHWYKTTFYDENTPAETAYSSASLGEFIDTNFSASSYPEEGVYTNSDRLVIDKVRTLIGDRKELTRDYVSPTVGYTSISEDGYTHTLSNPRGWPTRVVLDDVEYTSEYNPEVNDYQYITFSGIAVNTVSGTLDVWYYHFRHSDSEILRVCNALVPPAPLTEEQVTFELSILCTAIELLASELRLSGSTSGVEVDIFEEIRINPKVGLDSRFNDLQALLKMKDKIIASIINNSMQTDLCGVILE